MSNVSIRIGVVKYTSLEANRGHHILGAASVNFLKQIQQALDMYGPRRQTSILHFLSWR